MIEFDDAVTLIQQHAPVYEHETILVSESLHRTLAHDVYAPINLPIFDQSAVDGFAFNFADAHQNSLDIGGTIRAQGQDVLFMPDKKCVRIMTGAPLPMGADTVVMKEHVLEKEGKIFCIVPPKKAQYLRVHGGDVRAGTLVANAGRKITPAVLGLLMGLGIMHVKVLRAPHVTIIATGDELVLPGQPLAFGQNYYFVGPMVKAQLAEMGIFETELVKVDDDPGALKACLERALHSSELILFTGGMSQGEYDFVRPVLAEACVEQIFFQGKWRPGKPLYFGKKGKTRIFGLPGNPVASFACVHIFVQHLLAQAFLWPGPVKKMGVLAHNYEKQPGWTMFLRASVNECGLVTLAANQDSHQIFTLAQSNALCVIEATTAIVKAQSFVHYYPL